jgi:hypothetical protein
MIHDLAQASLEATRKVLQLIAEIDAFKGREGVHLEEGAGNLFFVCHVASLLSDITGKYRLMCERTSLVFSRSLC